jgi:hypothetical protein
MRSAQAVPPAETYAIHFLDRERAGFEHATGGSWCRDGWTMARPSRLNGSTGTMIWRSSASHPGPRPGAAGARGRSEMMPIAPAKTRSGKPCRAPAMPNGKCRMHGGRSPGAPKGERNGNYRHGRFTDEAV